MTDILGDLEQDHRNMVALLRVLEQQVTVFRAGQRPDYDIVQAVVEYCLDYPDQIHHPREDLLAAKLAEEAGDDAQALSGLAQQHAELDQLSRRFAEVVDNVLNEAELERDRFVHAAEDFISAQLQHMEMEEQHFFPMARARLTPEMLQDLSLEAHKREDPLFGQATRPRYEALRMAILEAEGLVRAG